MTTNPKAQSAVALPATHPETYYPTYSEWDLKQLLDGGKPSICLFTTGNLDVTRDYNSGFVQPYEIPVNLPILTKGEIREALRQIYMQKQAILTKKFAEEQTRILEELSKLTAIGYDDVTANIETPEEEEAGLLQAQAEADAKAEYTEIHDEPDAESEENAPETPDDKEYI